MITRIHPRKTAARWQHELASAISDPAELFHLLQLDPATLPDAIAASGSFKLRVPLSYLDGMRPGDRFDPLLLQALPLGEELLPQPADYLIDPVGDDQATAAPGVIHKYHGRVLLITTGACAIHCRYCFRRHFPYNESHAGRGAWQDAVAYLEEHEEVDEVILSGGDPLTMSDTKLSELSLRLDNIAHLKRLRIHTRLPVVLPSRVDDALLSWLGASRLKPVMVIHANHANELTPDVCSALATLHAAGVTLLNQTVLLKGINDDASTLSRLSHKLFENNVLPYYLHTLDKVHGAAHFSITESDTIGIMDTLFATLPGYLVPRLVREEAGAASKTPVYQKPS